MRLPEKKREELKEKGKRETPPVEGGGARGRLRQFEEERGLDESGLGNPAADDEPSDEKKGEND
jgi:hypothetical protein